MPNGQSRTVSKPIDCKRKTYDNQKPKNKSPGDKAEAKSAKTESSSFPSSSTSDELTTSQQNYKQPYNAAIAQLNTMNTGEPEGTTNAHVRPFYG